MQFGEVIQRVNSKKDLYYRMDQPVSFTEIWSGINRHPDVPRQKYGVETQSFPGRFITGNYEGWSKRIYSAGRGPVRQRSYGGGGRGREYIYLRDDNGWRRFYKKDFDALAANEKYTGDYGGNREGIRQNRVPGIDFVGSDFSGANLSDLNFGSKKVLLNSINSDRYFMS